MGKRELLLIVAFAVLGVVVYQVTAPAPAPGTEGASLSAIWHNLQRHIKGNQATAAADSTQSTSAEDIRELRVVIPRMSNISITGDDRADVSATLHVTGRGFDDAEAHAVAAATRVMLDHAGNALVIRLITTAQPRMTPIPQVTLTISVPRRFMVRVEPHTGPLTVANVASVKLVGARGETRVSGIAGAAEITDTGGELTLDGCDALKLSLRGVRATIQHVSGAATIEAFGGRIDMNGVRAETRIDSRNTRLDVTMATATPVTIYSTSEDIAVTPAAAGYTLDAAATDGRITIADAHLEPSGSNDEQHASGPVRGGGPPLVLHATHANVTVRAYTK